MSEKEKKVSKPKHQLQTGIVFHRRLLKLKRFNQAVSIFLDDRQEQ